MLSWRLIAFSVLFSVGAPANAVQDSLASQVTIYRDGYGVPHIFGETEEATFFGYGYAQAQDHLEKMMTQYRDAQGRRAEVLGFEALGGGYLRLDAHEHRYDGDYLQRLLRTKRAVVDDRGKMDPQVYRILAAFARGINAYIVEHRSSIPAWIDEITAEDVEALERSHYLRYYSIHLALLKLNDLPFSFPNFGSNQFAISPLRSANGRIIHVEHTHMPWTSRLQNYEAHLITPGKLNAGGISWFGSPFFLDGFNDRITWSATSNFPNIADVYEERLNPRNPLEYLYEGNWRRIQIEYETFRIKGPHEMESVTLPLYYTHHGPIVKLDRDNHRAFAVKLPNFEGVNYSAALYGLMKARDLDQFKAVVARQWMPKWNLLYTDATNLYWVHNGNVARRSEGFDWRKPVPGWTKETEWGPYIPFEEYPQILNPPSGFLQNCNDPPWVVTKDSGLKPLAPAPYYLLSKFKADAGEEVLGSRGERLFGVLSQNRKFTLDDIRQLALDTYVLAADVIVPLLQQAVDAAAPKDARLQGVVRQLSAWDRRSSKDSVAFTYMYFWGKSYQDLFSKQNFSRFLSPSRKQIDIQAPEERGRALAALEEGLNRIQKRFGKIDVPWGAVNVVVRGETFPLDGNGLYGVLHPDEGIEQENGQIHCDDGWGHLMIVIEGETKEIWSLLPLGESEDHASPHYNDQARLHSQGQIKRFWFTARDILDHTESVWGEKNRIK